jgi:hypothetical protein
MNKVQSSSQTSSETTAEEPTANPTAEISPEYVATFVRIHTLFRACFSPYRATLAELVALPTPIEKHPWIVLATRTLLHSTVVDQMCVLGTLTKLEESDPAKACLELSSVFAVQQSNSGVE